MTPAGRAALLAPPKNLLSFPSDLSNAYWSKVAGTISADAAAGPDGNVTADKFIPSAAAAIHGVNTQNYATTIGQRYRVKVNVKPAGYNYIAGSLFGPGQYVYFDLSAAGSVMSTLGTNIVSADTPIQLAGGWFLISYVYAASAVNSGPYIFTYNAVQANGALDPTFTGDAVSGTLFRDWRLYRA